MGGVSHCPIILFYRQWRALRRSACPAAGAAVQVSGAGCSGAPCVSAGFARLLRFALTSAARVVLPLLRLPPVSPSPSSITLQSNSALCSRLSFARFVLPWLCLSLCKPLSFLVFRSVSACRKLAFAASSCFGLCCLLCCCLVSYVVIYRLIYLYILYLPRSLDSRRARRVSRVAGAVRAARSVIYNARGRA